MSNFEDSALSIFSKSIPSTDSASLVTLFKNLTQNAIDYDSFIMSIGSFIDFSRISSVDLLLKMTFLPNDRSFMTDFIKNTFKYIPVLMSIPQFLDENYTEGRLINDFRTFLIYEKFSDEWYLEFTKSIEGQDEAVTEIFTKVLYEVSHTISLQKQSLCVPYLQTFERLITPKNVRIILSKAKTYYQTIRNLFTQSVFATDSISNAKEFFIELPEQVTVPLLKHLDEYLSVYHLELVKIMRILLLSSTAHETLKVLQQFINECSVLSKSNFVFTQVSQNKRIEAFCINVESVIVQLSLIMRDKYPQIDPFTPYYPNSYSPIAEETLTLSEITTDEEEEFQRIVKENSTKPLTFVSNFYFLASQSIDCMTCSLIRLLGMIQKNLNQMEEANNSRNLDPLSKQFVNQKIKTIKVNYTILFSHIILPSRKNNLLEFIDMSLNYLLYIGNVTNDNNVNIKPTIQFAKLPEYILNSITMTLDFFIGCEIIKDPFPYLNKLSLIFVNKNYIKIQEQKAKIIQIFAKVSNQNEYQHLILSISNSLNKLFPSILEFYSSVQVKGSNSSLYERFEYRISCTDLVNYLLNYNEFQEYFLTNLNDKTIKEFIYFLVDDTMYFADQSMSLFRTIYTANHSPTQNVNTFTGENLEEEIQNEIWLSRNNLTYWLLLCNKSIDLMVHISRFAPNSFHDEVVLDEFTKLILMFIDSFVNQQKYMMVDKREELRFDPWKLFVSLLTISNAVSNDELVVQKMVENETFHCDTLFEKAFQIAEKHKTPETENVINEFKKFAELLKVKKEEFEKQQIDYSDAPDEFLDELLMDIMDEPMKLPSGHYMDKKNLERQLLTNNNDPFTLVPLKMEECTLDVELKKRIDEYKERKRNQK